MSALLLFANSDEVGWGEKEQRTDEQVLL